MLIIFISSNIINYNYNILIIQPIDQILSKLYQLWIIHFFVNIYMIITN